MHQILKNRVRYTFITAIWLLLAACGKAHDSAIDVLDLLMPHAQAFGVERIQHKSVLVADTRGVGAQSDNDMQALKQQGISSSAYFKYWLNDKQAYKVRINVYQSQSALQKSWKLRYPEASLTKTKPLNLGDQGFVQGQRIGAFANGLALVEISASKGAPELEAFLIAYGEFVASKLAN